MKCERHGETEHDPYTAECLECLRITPLCAGAAGGCQSLGNPDPVAHDRNECAAALFLEDL